MIILVIIKIIVWVYGHSKMKTHLFLVVVYSILFYISYAQADFPSYDIIYGREEAKKAAPVIRQGKDDKHKYHPNPSPNIGGHPNNNAGNNEGNNGNNGNQPNPTWNQPNQPNPPYNQPNPPNQPPYNQPNQPPCPTQPVNHANAVNHHEYEDRRHHVRYIVWFILGGVLLGGVGIGFLVKWYRRQHNSIWKSLMPSWGRKAYRYGDEDDSDDEHIMAEV